MNNSNYLNEDLSPEQRAEHLLQELSLEEKMGQINCYFPRGLDTSDLSGMYPNGVGHVSSLEMRGLASIEDCAQLQRQVQEEVIARSEHNIPAIFHMEGVAGVYIQGATSFPVGIGRGSSWNVPLEEKVASVVSRQARAMGISQVFAPVLDINRDSRMGRQGECYSEDPSLAAAMGVAYVKGIQKADSGRLRADSVAKHFVGSHAVEGGIHAANCEIGEPALRESFGKPFQAVISESGIRGMMPSYNSINGKPISVSKGMLEGLLREEMGFDGVAVSDYCALLNVHKVQKLYGSMAEAGLRGLEAGMDVELHMVQCFNDELRKWFEEGKADVGLLDRAVLRILVAKFRMGLFENPYALSGDELKTAFFRESDRSVSRQSAQESLVLLKNNGVLPVRNSPRKIALIGCFGKAPRSLFGGYTHLSMAEALYAANASMAGVKGENGEKKEMKTYPGSQVQADDVVPESLVRHIAPTAKSLFEELGSQFSGSEILYAYGYPYDGYDTSGFEGALEAANEADLVILALGGKHGTSSIASMGEGVDATSINLPYCQEEFIKEAAKLGKPMVGIHFNGRPISSDAADAHLDAILEAWNPGETGAEVIAEILSGAVSPSGKLPVTVAYHAGQIPIYYNHPNGSSWHQGESVGFSDYVDCPHTPRYPFGHGLSYTEFAYSDLRLDEGSIDPRGEVTVSFTVTNQGAMDGDEIVQFYLSDRLASMTRPNKELAGFGRVSLRAGESRRVRFALKASQTAFFTDERKWKIEAGIFDVLVGASSEDIRLKGEFSITEDRWIEGRDRSFYARIGLG